MDIVFQGNYDRKVFFDAVRIANRPTGNQKRFLRFMMLFACGGLILMLYKVFNTGDFAGNAILLFAALILVIVMVGISLQPYFTARKLWAGTGVQRNLKGVISNNGIKYQLKEGVNEIPWFKISRIRKGDGLVTLIRNDGLLMVFPRVFFKRDSDWRKFNQLVDKRISQNQKG